MKDKILALCARHDELQRTIQMLHDTHSRTLTTAERIEVQHALQQQEQERVRREREVQERAEADAKALEQEEKAKQRKEQEKKNQEEARRLAEEEDAKRREYAHAKRLEAEKKEREAAIRANTEENPESVLAQILRGRSAGDDMEGRFVAIPLGEGGEDLTIEMALYLQVYHHCLCVCLVIVCMYVWLMFFGWKGQGFDH
jgi:hypothetical protein